MKILSLTTVSGTTYRLASTIPLQLDEEQRKTVQNITNAPASWYNIELNTDFEVRIPAFQIAKLVVVSEERQPKGQQS